MRDGTKNGCVADQVVDCKTVVFFFFSKSIKKSIKRGVRVLRAYLNTQKYCSRVLKYAKIRTVL